MMRAKLTVAAIVMLLGGIAPAEANFVTYTFSGTGTGSLGSQNFTNDSFSITVTSDTSLITPFRFIRNNFVNNGYSISPSATIISLANVGVASFTGGAKVFDNNSTAVLGIQLPSNFDLIDLPVPLPFATYDLQTSIGPIFVASPTAVQQFRDVATSSGSLSFTGISNVTFRANVVPEPASLAMLGMGMLGLVGLAARRAGRGGGRRGVVIRRGDVRD